MVGEQHSFVSVGEAGWAVEFSIQAGPEGCFGMEVNLKA